jgi:hypothetical protein
MLFFVTKSPLESPQSSLSRSTISQASATPADHFTWYQTYYPPQRKHSRSFSKKLPPSHLSQNNLLIMSSSRTLLVKSIDLMYLFIGYVTSSPKHSQTTKLSAHYIIFNVNKAGTTDRHQYGVYRKSYAWHYSIRERPRDSSF